MSFELPCSPHSLQKLINYNFLLWLRNLDSWQQLQLKAASLRIHGQRFPWVTLRLIGFMFSLPLIYRLLWHNQMPRISRHAFVYMIRTCKNTHLVTP
uniref:Uncharacterized protein n=1 Tax=Physcomitrium patens TaxID=3218 RepID=A0A2K1KT18_PHYPA|nr:hypothetical protein PHYPA_003902 [Physcomitrium patens]